jgi:hypothetical protein
LEILRTVKHGRSADLILRGKETQGGAFHVFSRMGAAQLLFRNSGSAMRLVNAIGGGPSVIDG